jgi:putative membrane protein
MYIQKNYSLKSLIALTGGHLVWLTAWSLLVAALHEFTPLRHFNLPWLPLSLIGTAVAFYVGFKNNQAYDRLWEGRKIWGSIINSSRAWGSMVKAYISGQFAAEGVSASELYEIKRALIYRQIAWVYTLRHQLLISTPWEHVSLRGHFGVVGQQRRKHFGIGLYPTNITEQHLSKYLTPAEYASQATFKNAATQMIDIQAQELSHLRSLDLVNDFRQVELQKILNDLYDHQGRAERLKKFPLPRQYGSMSFIFVSIFIFMLPFGMVSEFSKLGDWGLWLSVPFCVMVGWVFVVMEMVGDYSENPFEGLANDVPMFALCRTIEIDLLQQLGETELPSPVEPVNNVLM